MRARSVSRLNRETCVPKLAYAVLLLTVLVSSCAAFKVDHDRQEAAEAAMSE